jgi:hypothetical protein
MLCRGRAALTDCHYLSKSLGPRHLAGYYLGCAMSDPVREAVEGIFEVIERGAVGSKDTELAGVQETATNEGENAASEMTVRSENSIHIEKVWRL